jgi:cytochrome P450
MLIPPSHEHAVRLYGPEFADNPAGIYAEIRRQHGGVAPILLEGDVPAWLVLSYRELHRVTGSPEIFGRDPQRWNLLDQIPPDWPLAAYTMGGPAGLFTEGAEHRRRYNAMSDTLDAVDRTLLTQVCQRTADRLIDDFAGDAKADLITQYAQLFPVPVMARMFGFSEADAQAMSEDILYVGMNKPGAQEVFLRAYGRMAALIAGQRDRKGTWIVDDLLRHPAQLTEEEAAWDLHTTLIPVQDSTSNWIGNTLRLMLSDDHFSLALQGGRSSVAQALNEVLWKETPNQNFIGRYATQDCELGGWRIAKGDMVVLGLAAANADPQVFPESFGEPGTNRAHMAFSHGEYACPYSGAEIGEIMARTAIEVLLDRVPDVELAVPVDSLRWRETVWYRSLHSLPVTFTPVSVFSR